MLSLKLAVISPSKFLRSTTSKPKQKAKERINCTRIGGGGGGERVSFLIYRDEQRSTCSSCYTTTTTTYRRDLLNLPFKSNKALLGLTFRYLFHNHHRSSFVSPPNSSFSKHTTGSHSSGSGMGSDTKPVFVSAADSSSNYNHNHNHNPQQPSNPMQNQNQHSSKLLTLPTILTLARVAAVPLLISTFYIDSWWGRTATTSIFIAAAITDWLDGYIARKMKLGSSFGAFLDPVADKLMVAATLVLLCTKPYESAIFGQVPWLLTVPSIAIIGREITMSAVREWAACQGGKLVEAVAVSNLGKWKTASQMIALTILLATRDNSANMPGVVVASGVILLYISAGLSVWSLYVYMGRIWRVLLK